MRYAKDLNGKHTPWIRKYQISATVSRVGTPVVLGGASTAGVANGTTTSCTNFLGVAWSTATYVTAQQSAGTYMNLQKPGTGADSERLIEVCINPMAVWEMVMTGSATDGTALSQHTVTTASTDGLAVTTATAWNSPEFDEGVVWCYSGANAGRSRKLTSTSGTAGTVTVAFQDDIAVGDVFLRAPYWPAYTSTVQLTTNLTDADASIAVATGAGFRCVELALYDVNAAKGLTQSKVYVVPTDHILNNNPTNA